MRHLFRVFAFFSILICCVELSCHAQKSLLTITVQNSGNGNQPYENVSIYIFDTERQGENAFKKWEKDHTSNIGEKAVNDNGWQTNGKAVDLQPDGLFFLDGSIVVVSEDFQFAKFHKIKNNPEIIIQMDGVVSDTLNESTVVAEREKIGEITFIPEDDADYIDVGIYYPLDERICRTDKRVVLETFLTPVPPEDDDSVTTATASLDTLEWRLVSVRDGAEFHRLQRRRMGFPKDPSVIAERDPLFVIADKSKDLDKNTLSIEITDKVYKTKAIQEEGAMYRAMVWATGYNQLFFDQLRPEQIDLRKLNRPMRFLEYNSAPAQFDPKDKVSYRKPQRNEFPGQMQLPIQFEVNSATVDMNNPTNVIMLDSLRRTIEKICHDKYSTISQLSVSGTSSPEGGYAANASLARERMQYIMGQIMALIPIEKRADLHNPTTNARVATWDEVAEILAADGYWDEASQIRAITAALPNNPDAQNARVYSLPCYNTIIKDHLSQLRMVTIEWTHIETRAMTPQEVLDKFYSDPNLEKKYTDYELWVLLQKLTEPEELEPVCKLAMKQDSLRNPDKKERWLMPINVLASSYIKRGVIDTTLLAPYIEDSVKCDRPHKPYGERGQHWILNPAQMIANQIIMFLRTENNYKRAYKFANLLDKPEVYNAHPEYDYKLLVAVTRCKAQKTDRPRFASYLRQSSIRNKVVMDLSEGELDDAAQGLEQMDQDDPLTLYLKAQLECKRHEKSHPKNCEFSMMSQGAQKSAVRNLAKCFQRDSTYLKFAREDWFIFSGLYDKARKDYKNLSFQNDDSPKKEVDVDRIKDILSRGAANFEELTNEEKVIFKEIKTLLKKNNSELTEEEKDLVIELS